jgi:hypothetical protein
MGSGHDVVTDHHLEGSQAEIRRQCIKPIRGPVNLHERLDALPAAWKEIPVVVGIQAEGDAPLAEVGEALRGTPASFGLRKDGKKHGRKDGDDRHDHQQLD